MPQDTTSNMDSVFKDINFDAVNDVGVNRVFNCWSQFLSRVYGWNNNTTFFATVPAQWQNYYRNTVQTCINFAQGYDPTVHGQGKLIPTRIGSVIIRILVDKIMSGDVQFDDISDYKENEQIRDNAARFISDKWSKDFNFTQFLFRLFTNSTSGGVSLIKLNIDKDGNLWPDALRVDRFFVNLDSMGKVNAARCYVNIFEGQINKAAGNGSDVKNWVLTENRYMDDRIPYVEYAVNPLEGLVNSRTFGSIKGVDWKVLPKDVKDAFVDAYGTKK